MALKELWKYIGNKVEEWYNLADEERPLTMLVKGRFFITGRGVEDEF